MFNNIKTSKANKEVVTDLTRKLQLGPENIIARLALGYSLSKDRKLNLSDIRDSGGKEYSRNVLFGQYHTMYVALICQQYQIYKTDKDIPKYVKMHIDDGLDLLKKEIEDNPNLSGFDFLAKKIEVGLKSI